MNYKTKNTERPIGIIDSGLGGLSILRALRTLMPREDYIYFADTANLPYGEKPQQEIRQITAAASLKLRQRNIKMLVLACNSATIMVIHHLRKLYPGLPIIGVVPMVKPAAEVTKSGVVAVFATSATLDSDYYASLKETYANGIKVLDVPSPGWVDMVEYDSVDAEALQIMVEHTQAEGADTLVLGCTHFPFLADAIRPFLKRGSTLLESGPAVARHVHTVLSKENIATKTLSGKVAYYTSSVPIQASVVASRLLGEPAHFEAFAD